MLFGRESQCDGKVKWQTRQLAREARRRLQNREGAATVAVYRCSHCQQYHIGNRRSDSYVQDLLERVHSRSEAQAEADETLAAVARALGVSLDEARQLTRDEGSV